MSEAVVVAEAAEHPGALLRAEAALDLHKEVMAVPGSVLSPVSPGTRGLICARPRLVQEARDGLATVGATQEVLDDSLRRPKACDRLQSRAAASSLTPPTGRP